MTQLRFVPNGAYTGSVSIPYVALGSSGTAIAAGTVSIGIVNSVKKFTDISSFPTPISSPAIPTAPSRRRTPSPTARR